MTLSLSVFLRNALSVSGARFIGVVVAFVTSMVVARMLGPVLLGTTGFLSLCLFYAIYARPGIYFAGIREVQHLLGQNRGAAATRIQNIALSGEYAFLIVPVSSLLLLSTHYTDPVLRYGLWITALVVVLMTIRDFMFGVHWSHQRFGVISKAALLANLAAPVFMLCTVKWFGAYSVVISPGIAAVTTIIVFRKFAPSIGFRPLLERRELWRLERAGFPLFVSTICYSGYRVVDRTAIAAWLPLAELGYFVFISQFVDMAVTLLTDFVSVVQPTLLAELGKSGNIKAIAPKVISIIVALFGATCIIANASQCLFSPFVLIVTPKLLPAAPVFEILMLNVACLTVTVVPMYLLDSTALHRQAIAAKVWAAGLLLNALFDVLVLRVWHAGLEGVAWSSVLAQLGIAVVLFGLTHHYLFAQRSSAITFYVTLGVLFMVSLAVYTVFQLPAFAFSSSHGYIANLMVAGKRLVTLCALWSAVCALGWQWLRLRGALFASRGGLIA